MNKKDKLSVHIKPKIGWFEINIKELFHYKDLIWLFVKRDFVYDSGTNPHFLNIKEIKKLI